MANDKKNEALGMNFSTASAQLKKNLMFKFMQVLNLDQCFQCGEVIDAVDQLSVEHKQPWLSATDPKAAFFDLNNIAFSHLSCNVAAGTTRKCLAHQLSECAECRRDSKQRYRNSSHGKDARRKYNRVYMKTWTPKSR